jgi:hypothetical protein
MFAESLRLEKSVSVASVFLHVPDFPVMEFSATHSEVAGLIRADVRSMLALTNFDTDVREELFDPVDDPVVCAVCPFQRLC